MVRSSRLHHIDLLVMSLVRSDHFRNRSSAWVPILRANILVHMRVGARCHRHMPTDKSMCPQKLHTLGRCKRDHRLDNFRLHMHIRVVHRYLRTLHRSPWAVKSRRYISIRNCSYGIVRDRAPPRCRNQGFRTPIHHLQCKCTRGRGSSHHRDTRTVQRHCRRNRCH